jgi:hypothetical protein
MIQGINLLDLEVLIRVDPANAITQEFKRK